LYSCLIWDAGMMEMDCCLISQHSTSTSDLISVLVAALDALASLLGLCIFLLDC
jgi:hypothetical protein